MMHNIKDFLPKESEAGSGKRPDAIRSLIWWFGLLVAATT